MNVLFWILTIVMLLLAIGLLVFPLLKTRQHSALAYKESNLKINDEKIEELNRDLAEGRIDQALYAVAREELDRELLLDIPLESKETSALHYSAPSKRQPTIALIISIFVPMLALLLYLDLGMHAANDENFSGENFAASQQQAEKLLSIEEMSIKLEQRMQENGGTAKDWAMLARSHKYLGKFELAAKAFEVSLQQDENNAQLMLEFAEVIALANEQKFNEKSRALVLKAYQLEPDNANVLWFAGVAEFQYGNYREAIDHLVQLFPSVAGEEDVMKSVVSIIAQSRTKLIAAGEKIPELEELLDLKSLAARAGSNVAPDKKAPAAAAGKRLQVAVNVSDEVRQRFDGKDVVFIYAKAKQGPRFPLAATRMTLAELPATIVLDDSMAMVEGMNLSAFSQLVVSARISKSGSAIAQSGDFIGKLDVSENSMSEIINIVIDSAVP